jgi:hypothetical protein
MPKENRWKKEEDDYIEENYTGSASLPHISEKLGRSIASLKRRVMILISEGPEFQEGRMKRMCELHARDLKESGGRWT